MRSTMNQTLFSTHAAATRRRLLLTAAVSIAALAGAAPSWAQPAASDFPNKPIRIVVPYAAGGSSDTLGRLIARHLQEAFKQTVVIENKAGAGGLIGSREVSKAAPDGYTLVVSGIGSHVIAPVEAPAGFDPMKDFTHIAMLAGPPLGVVVHAEQPFRDLKALVQYAKDNPKGLSWGSPGQGTHGHLTGELLRKAGQLNMVHIAYKGGGPAVADLLGNQIPAAITAFSSSNAFVDTGKLRLLAVSSSKRLVRYPEAPTLAELGYPQLTGTTWFALSGPPGMPKEIVDRLNNEVRRGLQTQALRSALAAESMETMDLDAASFTQYVASEITRWTPAIKSLGGSGK
jgi:tripartite-type tricarboxylate transporter receptor subunit TctC